MSGVVIKTTLAETKTLSRLESIDIERCFVNINITFNSHLEQFDSIKLMSEKWRKLEIKISEDLCIVGGFLLV